MATITTTECLQAAIATTVLSDAQAAIISIADVSSGGTEGKAIFTLTPADTAVAPGTYHYDIVWRRHGGGEYVLARNVVRVLDRVSDL